MASFDSYTEAKRSITEEDIAYISKCIGDNWEFLGIHMGLKTIEIQQLKQDIPLATRKQISAMLARWKQIEKENATLEKLFELLEKSECSVSWDSLQKKYGPISKSKTFFTL